MALSFHKRFLLAVDGSGSARRAAREATELAAIANAHVHVVYVVHPWGLAPYSGYYEPAALSKVLYEDGRQALDEVRQAMIKRNVSVSVEICETLGKSDSISQCLLRCAATRDVDLAVMGTHGKHGLGRAFLGSVAEEFLRIARCPVLIVRC